MFGSKLLCRPTEELTKEEILNLSLTEILKVRTVNMLEEEGILYVRDLLTKTKEDLLAIDNFGKTTLEEVMKALEVLGFKWMDTNTTLLTIVGS